MALTIVYTNTTTSTMTTSSEHGNLSIAPSGTVTLSAFNAALDSEVAQGNATRTVNGVADNVVSDDGIYALPDTVPTMTAGTWDNATKVLKAKGVTTGNPAAGANADNLAISAGTAATDKTGGNVTISAGGAATGAAGSVNITAGSSASGTQGLVALLGAASHAGVQVTYDGATKVGFFETAPAAKPAVTGSKASGAALTSLLAALVALGLITDSTEA